MKQPAEVTWLGCGGYPGRNPGPSLAEIADPGLPVEERVRRIAGVFLDVDPAAITPKSRFREDLKLDSVDQVELVSAFEEAFGIQIRDEEVEQVATVEQAVQLIERKLKQVPQGLDQGARGASPGSKSRQET